MSMTLDLSATLRGKLASVARRIRLLRAARGTALLLLTLAVTAGLALLADYAFTFAPVVRGVLLTLWVGLGNFVALFGLILPVQRSLDSASLAALIEEKYPELGERLTSSVELSATPDAYHGSHALIALLLEETEVRTRPLDFLSTVSPRRPLQVAAAAGVALLFAVTPAFVWPEQYGELGERFLAPWRVPPVVIPYSVKAEPGDGFVKQGDPFTISARLVRDHDDVQLPGVCTLVVTDGKTDQTQRLRMLVDSPTAFSYKIERVGNSFRYHVEAGDARSRQYDVTSVVPVKLASTAITPVAPAYALKAKYADKPADGIVDLTALQHSRVTFDLRFTRDAVHASLLLTPVPASPAASGERRGVSPPVPPKVTMVPLELTADRTAAKGEFTLTADMQARLVLEAEHGIRTEYGPVILFARKDAPPSILFKGKDDLPPVSVNDRVPMLFSAEDDVAVASAAIEYRINEGKVVAEEVKLDGAGTRSAEGKHEFALSGKVRHGDLVEYRIAVTDNRDVPEVEPPLTPQTSYYPPEGWLRLKVVNSVRPLNERDILAQRDDINKRIEKIKQDLRVEKRQAYGVQQEARNDDRLSDDHKERLAQIRKDNQKSRQDLADLAREVGDTPALEPIARTADEVAEGELKRTQNALDAAKGAKEPRKRYEEFSKADKELDTALRKLDELQKQNQRLAQQRLDRMQLQNLAERQQRLAEKAAELAAKDPLRDPSAPEQKAEIQREQNEVAAELQRLADQSEELRKSLDAARAEQAKELAEKARELAQAQRDLSKASAETENKRQAERLSDLARRQQELAKKAAELARDTKQPTQTARVAPLKPQEADRAAKALEQGDANKALQHQDRSALELDRVTADLDRAVKVSDDPREAARQLARLEEAMKNRVLEEARKKGAEAPLAERLKPLQQEQQAIAEAARQLSVPAKNKDAEKARTQASREAELAAEELKKQETAGAHKHIELARKALERLAYELPDLNKRRQEAQAEVERLRRQQEEIARESEQAARQAQGDPDSPKTKADIARRLQEAAKQQAETAERLSKVDPAAQDERKDRAEQALNRALADLLDGRKEDVPASQAEAKRQLQRLEQALAGQKPADEKAQELARRQQDLAGRAAKLAEDPKATPQQKAELQRQQQQVAQETQGLDAPEAPRRKAEAAQATKQAEQAANAQPTGEQTQKKMQEAAQALQRLADQMKGKESEPARAERLAKEQAEAAAEADRRARQNQQSTQEERQRQQQIAEEAKQLRGGEEGQTEKRRAQQALERVDKAPPNAQPAAQHQAADALRDLADKMAGRTDPAAKAQELARQQRELAREAQKPAETGRQADALRRAQQEQQELTHQLSRLDRKGAAEERKQAEAKMAEARKALEDARTPADAKPQLERAAQAAEDLARKLGQEQAAQQPMGKQGEQTAAKPADQSPQRMAQQAAQQQRELARATQDARRQAERQGGEPGKQSLQKALEQIGQEQQRLNQQASQLPANQNQKGLEQARQTMNDAQRALNRNDAAQAQRRQEEAARALENLARQLPQQQSAQAQRQQQGEQQPARPQGLPNRQQVEQARQLAQQQRELRQAVAEAQRELTRQADTPMKSPAQELARQQQEIARQAGELTRNVGKEQGQQAQSTQQARQAQQTTQQAANRLQAGALPQAQQAGQQAAQQLRQLAQQLGQTPRPDRADPQAPDPADQARRLAQQQDEVNRRMQPLAQDASAQRAQQQARQQDLKRQTGDLMQELSRLAQQSWSRNPQGAQQAQQASQSTQQAQQSMQQAQQQAREGNQGQARQQQQQAAQALDRAAQQAAQAARQMASAQQQSTPSQQQGSPQQAQAGQSVQQAQKQMGQAQGQLNQGQNQAAQSSMKQAGESLQQASQAMAQSQQQQPGQPGSVNNKPTVGVGAGGLPDLTRYGDDGRKYQGKTWGELPGSLQTRIIQDLKDQFGDDYARRIKLYFEQVSNTRKK